MKRKINTGTVLFRIWLGIWLAALVGSRLFLLFSDKIQITDSAGYFESAMVQEKAMQPVLSSCLAMLYQNSLKGLFMFVGNRIEAVPVYHTVLQILALVLFVTGSRKLFGKMTAFITGMVLLLLPQLFYSIYTVSPENFYLFLTALLFAILCLLIRKLLGKTIAEIVVKKQAEEAEEPEEEIEITIETEGTAEEIKVAAESEPEDEETTETVKQTQEAEKIAESAIEDEQQKEKTEEKVESKSEQKTVTFLENPLPLPKKHVRKKMDFKIDIKESQRTDVNAEDDFDFLVEEGDDFDF